MEGKCCKCEEYGWADPQKIVWKDQADRKEYCVFHAPREGKRGVDGRQLSAEEFNKIIFDRIELYRVRKTNSNADKSICNLTGTVFSWDISFEDFDENRPMPYICFDRAIFDKEVSFDSVVFQSGVFFFGTRFKEFSTFSETKFYTGAWFNGALFYDSVIFFKTEFSHVADFGFIELFCTIQFCQAVISCSFELSGTKQHPESFISFDSMSAYSISKLSFSSREVPYIIFSDCKLPSRLGLDVFSKDDKNSLLSCEELYRSMKQRAADEHDQPQVSRWHFREKLMQLKQLFDNERSNNLIEVVEDRDAKLHDRAKAWFNLLILPPYKPKFTLTGIYWALSGFGERATRSFWWLVAFALLSFAANATPALWDWNAIWLDAAANATMATIPFAKDIPGEGWVKVGRGLWQLLIAVQFTLFALAVRNRFRR